MDDIRPTHAELLALKDNLSTARSGLELLKSKRDALMLEFMQGIDTTLNLSDELNDVLREAQYALQLAQAREGCAAVHSAALASSGHVEVDVTGYKVMGVAVPRVEQHPRSLRSAFTRGYTLTDSTVRVDEAALGFEKAVGAIMKYAEAETRLRRLGREISHTNRRVNALEQVRIPRVEQQIHAITQALDERSREELFRLKKVKKKIIRRAR